MNYLKDASQYTLPQIRALHPQVSIPDGADLSDLGYAFIETVAQPTPTATQRITVGAPEEYEPGKWREVWVVTDIPLEELKQAKIIELAAIRYQHETAGITMNGATIKTDLDSQAKINGAWSAAQMNPAILIDWKAETGWIQIDAATITAIAIAVATYVQGCFSRERALGESLMGATTGDELLAIDLNSIWPERVAEILA